MHQRLFKTFAMSYSEDCKKGSKKKDVATMGKQNIEQRIANRTKELEIVVSDVSVVSVLCQPVLPLFHSFSTAIYQGPCRNGLECLELSGAAGAAGTERDGTAPF